VLGRFASGLCVVTALDDDGAPVGLTCQSFASVSLDPPLVLFVPAHTSRTWPVIERAGGFCVNVLAADQQALSDRMATGGAERFTGLDWTPAPATGAPVLGGTLAWIDCTTEAVHPAGDHHVVVGRVQALETGPSQDGPLLFFRSAYHRLDT
jgi:3-hydroxy-9,10-secoandrosta-1,3,5(10)-triene-9,17-dione monooxygenase reductase component